MTKKRVAFEAYYRERLPDADFSKPIWNVEFTIWSAAWDAALASPVEPTLTHVECQCIDCRTERRLENAVRTDEPAEGQVTVVTNEAGECVAVTRTDSEHRILSVIWERGAARTDKPSGDAFGNAIKSSLADLRERGGFMADVQRSMGEPRAERWDSSKCCPANTPEHTQKCKDQNGIMCSALRTT